MTQKQKCPKKLIDTDLAELKGTERWKKVTDLPVTSWKKLQELHAETDDFDLQQKGKYIYVEKEEELLDEAGSWTNETITSELIGEINGDTITWLLSHAEATDAHGRDYIRQPNYLEGLFSFF